MTSVHSFWLTVDGENQKQTHYNVFGLERKRFLRAQPGCGMVAKCGG
jgi:hypothetical protein